MAPLAGGGHVCPHLTVKDPTWVLHLGSGITVSTAVRSKMHVHTRTHSHFYASMSRRHA